MDLVVLDTETTGLEVSEGHRVIELGCVLLSNRKHTETRFTTTSTREERSTPRRARCME